MIYMKIEINVEIELSIKDGDLIVRLLSLDEEGRGSTEAVAYLPLQVLADELSKLQSK